MENLHNESRASDANKVSVTIPMIIWATIACAVLLAAWIVWSIKAIPCNASKFILENIAGVVGTLVALAAMVFGVTAANRGVFSKKGKRYYGKPFGFRKSNDFLTKYLLESHPNYPSLQQKISELLKSESDNPFDSPYYHAVYALQRKNDQNFDMAWNDFNYYMMKSHLSKKNASYLALLRQYVYLRVYEEHCSSEDKT